MPLATLVEHPILAATNREPLADSLVVVDGFGVSLRVNRGHLEIRDGIGRHRRERRLTRAQRTVQRIVILGHTGHITFDAIRWCHDIGITITHLDTDGRILLTATPPGANDPRLRRAQAAAANAPVGLDITRELIGAKIAGQAGIAATHLINPTLAATLADLADLARTAESLPECRNLEAQASNTYFGAWPATVTARFARRDQPNIPDHWGYYALRRSPISKSSPRTAADPINALLNYSYALAETECRHALVAVGLDPGLGIVHTDRRNRDSLALDLLEPLRPVVDAHILAILDRRHFTRRDFHETPTGNCRILPPLTHELADAIPSYAATIAPIAETIAHTLARSHPGKIRLVTPLSRANTVGTQTRGTVRKAKAAPMTSAGRPTCRECGVGLYGSARKLCPECWPITRQAYMRQLGQARAKPRPTKPAAEDLSGGITLQQYQGQIQPALATVQLRAIERATGLSNPSACNIRAGKQIPNPRHWQSLAALTATLDTQG